MRRRIVASAIALAGSIATLGGSGNDADAAPTEEVHSLAWFVHTDMINPGMGLDLAFYQTLIATRLTQANLELQGLQGPFDSGCCVELQSVSVTTFGTTGDGLDIVLDATQLTAVQAFGPGAYLIQTLNYCGGVISPTLLGCANTPGDFLVVALDAEDQDSLATVIGHERGHNAGLNHVSANECQLMKSGNGGGCLSVSECNSFIAKADTTGDTCECLDDVVGNPPLKDGAVCGASMLCSGGGCGADTGLAGSSLVAAGGAGTFTGEDTDDFFSVSAYTGDWGSEGAIGAEVTGVAVDEDTDIVYAIESLAGDDALITLDGTTGAKLSTIGTLTGKEVVIALAHDPTGNRLFGIEFDDDFFGDDCMTAVGIPGPCFSELFEIDPGNAAITVRGELNSLIVTDGVTGMAWDDTASVLYGSTLAGLFTLDLGTCNGSTCGSTQVDDVFRTPSGLTWDPHTGKLVREGGDGFGVTVIDIIDTASGTIDTSTGVDPFTVGGLGAHAVPEPNAALTLAAGSALLLGLAHRRGR